MHDDEHWMGLALEEAARAAQAGEVPVGAVVVLDGHASPPATTRRSPIAIPPRTPRSWRCAPRRERRATTG